MTSPIEKHQAAVAANPANPLARFSLGKALYDAGRFEDAAAHFGVALELKPDWMVVAILMGKIHQRLGLVPQAIDFLKRARDLAHQQNHEGPLAEVEALLQDLETVD